MVKNNMKITVDMAMSFARFEMGLDAWAESAVSGVDTEITAQQLQEATAREEYFRELKKRELTKHDFEELDSMQFLESRQPPRFVRSFGVELNSRGFARVNRSKKRGERKVKHIHDIEVVDQGLDGGFVSFEYLDLFGDVCFDEGNERFVRLRTKITGRTPRELDELKFCELKELYNEGEQSKAMFRQLAMKFYKARIQPYLTLELAHKLDIKKIHFYVKVMQKLTTIDSEFLQSLPENVRALLTDWIRADPERTHSWQKLRKVLRDKDFVKKYAQIKLVMNRRFDLSDGEHYLHIDTRLDVFKKFFKQFSKHDEFWKCIFSRIDTGSYPSFRRFLSFSRRFLRRDRFTQKCVECDERHFPAFMVGFYFDNGGSCSKKWCRECYAKRLTDTLDAKKNSDARAFAGEETHRGVFLWETKDVYMSTPFTMARIENMTWSYLAMKTGVSVDELKEHWNEDVKFLLNKPIERLEALLKNTKSIEENKLQGYLSNINGWRSFMQVLGYIQIPEVTAAICRCTDLLHEHRAGTTYRKMKEKGTEAMGHRLGKNWDEMYNSLERLLESAAYFKATIRRISQEYQQREIGFGMTLAEWSKDVMDQNQMLFDTCFNSAKRCQVCMNTAQEGSEEYGDMILPHEDSQWTFGIQTKVPCTTCRTCFASFLKHSSAIGKPELKCPAMNCQKALNEKHVAKVAPKGLEEYRFSLMRFSLKQCHNFKFCPNTSCGEGFAVPDCCASTEKLDRITCPKCDVVFCPSCNGEPHGDVSCLEHQKNIHKEIWGALGEEEKFMKQESKQCPFCLVWIEKNGGCNHMTCRHCCGEFCWVCGGDWRKHNQGLKCGSDEVKITRKPLKELYPFKRFTPARKKKISESEKFEAEFHSQLAYQSFIQGFEDGFEEYEEVQVWELDPTYLEAINTSTEASCVQRFDDSLNPHQNFLQGFQDDSEDSEDVDSNDIRTEACPDLKSASADVKPIELENAEEEVLGKQDADEEEDLDDKVVPAELFLTSNFTVEMQDSLAVTPIQMDFENDSGSETGEPEACETPEKRAPETKLATVGESSEKRAPELKAETVPDKKRSVKFSDAVDIIGRFLANKGGKVAQKPVSKYVVRYHKKRRFDVITQMNYFQFIQGFHIDEEITEPCEDVKIQA